MGCVGEAEPSSDGRLCVNCWNEGIRVLLRRTGSRYMRPAEAAALLGVSYISILRLVRSGLLPAVRLRRAKSPNGYRYLIPRKDFAAYLAALSTTPDAPSTADN